MPRIERKASDRLITSRERPFPIGWELGEFFDGSVELVVSNVVPGEPITVHWRVVRGLRGFDGNVFTLRLHIDGQFVYERQNIPVGQATVGPAVIIGGRAVDFSGEANFQTESVIITNATVARLVYRIPDGQQSKRAILTANVNTEVSGARSFEGSVRFRISREIIGERWWQWRVPPYEPVAWKSGFTLVGDFVNQSHYASMAFLSAELPEVRGEENPEINPCEFPAVAIQSRNAIPRQGRAGFSFDRLHDWGWLSSGTYHIYGPLHKTFAYGVLLKFVDEFGNSYEGCSARVWRRIAVSHIKMAAAAIAMGGVLNAAILAAAAAAAVASIIGAPSAPFFAAAAAAAYVMAAAAGEKAKDPPIPDPRYREPVEVVPLAVPQWPSDERTESITALRSLLEAAAHMLALENARTVSRARLPSNSSLARIK